MRVVTKSAMIETFLADLDAMKERGIVGAELVVPPWAGSDSDEASFECSGSCKAELPADTAITCAHCGCEFCALCFDGHSEWVNGRRL